jgi:hypothetical protein
VTADRIHDVCLIQLLDYRAKLNAASCGYPSYTVGEVVEHNQRMLEAWETIDRLRDWSALTPDQQQMLLAATRHGG